MDPRMDATLAWEILSLLSLPSSPAHGAPDSDREAAAENDVAPFFAQRAECAEGDDPAASDAGFVRACPLRRRGAAAEEEADGDDRHVPALYARDAIAEEFVRALRRHPHGRASASELGLWLGMEEDHVEVVGRWLCSDSDRRARPADIAPTLAGRGPVCRVCHPATRRREYALVEPLRARLREGLARRASRAPRVPSLEALAPPSSRSADVPPAADAAALTTRELARELELTCEDVAWLLEDAGGTRRGEEAPGQVGTRRSCAGRSGKAPESQSVASQSQHLEKQVLSRLSGVTLPTPVRTVENE